jgi:membrane protein implicated in regulation of membrane protease activity
LLPVYIGALALGGVLIAASVVMGGKDTDHDADGDLDHDHDFDHDHDLDHDHDFDHDIDADADADIDADADAEVALGHGGPLDADSDIDADAEALWLPFLSMRFWTFGLASFGLSGTLLTLLSINAIISAAFAVMMGVSMGWLVAWTFRKLKKSSTGGQTSTAALRGEQATVLLSVGPEKTGKIRLLIDNQNVDLLARTRDPGLIERNEKVLIVSVEDGIAQITRVRGLDPQDSRPRQRRTVTT